MRLCPWCGRPCDCTRFPWKEAGQPPEKCRFNRDLHLLAGEVSYLRQKLEDAGLEVR